MKTRTIALVTFLWAASLPVLWAAPQDAVEAAAKKLSESSYTWKITFVGGNFNPGPTVGKIGEEGVSVVSRPNRDNHYLTVHHGNKAVMETDDGWKTLAELESDPDDRRNQFRARLLAAFHTPTEQVTELLKGSQDLTESDGLISGELTEDAVKRLLSWGRRGDGEGPQVSGAVGSVKFWIEAGVVRRYEYHVEGSIEFNGNDFDVDRTTTVEISNVGSTKVEVPAEARKKLS